MLVLNVNKSAVTIASDAFLNKGEYNVTQIKFNFSNEYSGLA